MSIRKGLLLFFCLLLSFSAHTANKTDAALKLPDNLKGFVRWMPISPSHSYREQLPQPEKITGFQKLGYGAVALTEKHDIVLKSDAIVEETVTSVHLYVSRNGIENSGNNGFWIDTNNQQVEIQEAYVLQPDGNRVNVDAGTLQINSDNSSGTFNDYYYVTVPFAQLAPGSISILVYKTVSSRQKSPLPWSRILFPANFEHIESFQVQASWADGRLKPDWRTDDARLACAETAFSLHCATKQAMPPIPTEQQMPPVYDLLPVLVLAEPASWADISNTMQTLTGSALSKTEKIQELAAHLVKDTTGPEDKLSRLSRFVSREIRYVGIEHGHGGIVPKPTQTTLAQGFGDCKDKTMLFVDLARQAGLDAYPVLTSTKREAVAKLLLPSSAYFNHMIACVRLNAGKEACLDLTDPDTAWTNLPQALHGAVSLPVGREAAAPANLASEPFTWTMAIMADYRFNDNGAITETMVRSYGSHWAASLRRTLNARSQADRERWLMENYRAVMGDKTAPSIELEGLDDNEADLDMISTTEYRNAFNPAQLTYYNDADLWLKDITKSLKTTNTHYPFSFQGFSYKSEITYKLHAGKAIKNLGPALDYVSSWGSFRRHYRKHDAKLTVYTEVKIPKTVIPPDRIPDFNRFIDLAYEENRVWFSLEAAMIR